MFLLFIEHMVIKLIIAGVIFAIVDMAVYSAMQIDCFYDIRFLVTEIEHLVINCFSCAVASDKWIAFLQIEPVNFADVSLASVYSEKFRFIVPIVAIGCYKRRTS